MIKMARWYQGLLAGACAVALLSAGCGKAATPAPSSPAPNAAAPKPAAPQAAIVAHRGGKPENTLSAFKTALATASVSAIELDVQVSSDGELFIMHDTSVDRTTDGKGEIAKLTAAQLRELKTPKGGAEPIPTLDQVLALVAATPDKRVFIEIKEPTPADTPAKVLALVKKYQLTERSVVCSFDLSLVEATRKLDPKQPTAFISKTLDKAELAFAGDYLMITQSKVERNKLEAAHKAGKKVYVWTVNEKMGMETFLLMGADGIISDEYQTVAEVKQRLTK